MTPEVLLKAADSLSAMRVGAFTTESTALRIGGLMGNKCVWYWWCVVGLAPKLEPQCTNCGGMHT